jgi:5-formyltetrahydrofolate cyclo-ligase
MKTVFSMRPMCNSRITCPRGDYTRKFLRPDRSQRCYADPLVCGEETRVVQSLDETCQVCSTVPHDSHLLAHLQHGTGGALGQVPCANVLSERYQQTVDLHPIALRKYLFERYHRLFRCRGSHITPAVGDAVHVDVHADVGLAVGDAQHKMSTFWSDTRERLQDLWITGQIPLEFVKDTARNLMDLGGFALVESAFLDQVVDLAWRELVYLGGCASALEQSLGSWQGYLVVGADGDHTRHQLLERGIKAQFSQLEHGCLWPGLDGGADTFYRKINIEWLFHRESAHKAFCHYNAPMFSSVTDQKSQLRQRCKAVRKGLGDEIRQQASLAIYAHLAAWDDFQSAETILTYMPMRGEVDLRSLLADFPEKCWLLPRIPRGEDGRMVFHEYDPNNLIVHPYGMAEPAPYLPQVPADGIQLVLAPGLAFDRSGWRLGYGGGYYDRFLQGFTGISVGVTFHVLLLEHLPHGEYDVCVGWLVSEDGLIKSTGK